jgi:hypothetical protein
LDPAATDEPTPWQWSPLARGVFLITGVILPVVCFVCSAGVQPEWQSGSLGAYAMLLLSWNWIIMCVVLVCEGGLTIPQIIITSALVVMVPWGVIWLLCLHVRRVDVVLPFLLAPILVLVAGFPAVAFALALVCATPWAVAAYGYMAFSVFRHNRGDRFQFTLRQLLGVTTWLAAYMGCWRLSVILMLREYATLPTEAPDCYVCTAASRGHRWLVRAEEHFGTSGEVHRVNDQMRRLKCAELVLKQSAPSVHRACRAIYDRVGPPMAATLVHPLLADVAYLSLKPAEWAARAGLALILPGHGELTGNLYRHR